LKNGYICADVQYYGDIVGGSEKVQQYADVIYGWSLSDLYLRSESV
jgi:hypothetical protein